MGFEKWKVTKKMTTEHDGTKASSSSQVQVNNPIQDSITSRLSLIHNFDIQLEWFSYNYKCALGVRYWTGSQETSVLLLPLPLVCDLEEVALPLCASLLPPHLSVLSFRM